MVKVEQNKFEKINLMSIDDKQDMNFIYIETNGGEFKYLFPIVQKPNSVNKVIDLWDDNFSVIENDDEEDLETIVHTTNSDKVIPRHVISEAEEYSGAKFIPKN